ncbi:MAG: CHAD domain-containing protein [Burkholderiales bacterium]
MTLEEGLRAVVGDCLGHIRRHEAGVSAGADPESVHQMRVGLRRLKCALQLFEPARPLWRAHRDELAWLATTLGGARDWEVLAGDTLPSLNHDHGDVADWAALADAVRSEAAEHRRVAAEAVRSTRYGRLMTAMQAWVTGTHWRDGLSAAELGTLQSPLVHTADRWLARQHARLIERGRKPGHATAPQRHRARIAAKKLRYATGFFGALYPPSRVAHFTDALAALQDSFGTLNDAVVARRLLRTLAAAQPAVAPAAAAAIQALAHRRRRGRQAPGRSWRRFKLAKRPWAGHRTRA